jgi:hypothetical protein
VEAIRNRVPAIYQGEFALGTALGGVPFTVVGRPDFLVLDGDGYLIRDSKLSLLVDEEHHIEITLQLQLYGWLYEQVVGVPAKRLQVHAGKGDLVDVPYDGGTAVLAELARILELKRLGTEPYEPLGWTKCGGREQKVGKKAETILMHAEVLVSGKERALGPAAIPVHENYGPGRHAAEPRRA